MAIGSSDSPPHQVLRYRVRTVFLITTVIAALAAIAGPYYRSVGPEAQTRLLLFWSVILISIVASLYLRLRGSTRRGHTENVRFIVFSATDPWSARERPSALILGAAGVTLWLALSSFAMGEQQASGLFNSPWYLGFLIGSAMAGLIFGFVRRPFYLCDGGIPLAQGHYIPWKYIRYAAWMPESENKMKLRRYDGDIYIEVPPAIRDEVGAFIREKIGPDVIAAANI